MEKETCQIQRYFSIFAITVTLLCFAGNLVVSHAQPPGTGSETKREKAMVFSDPSNKKNVSGYAHIAYATGSRLQSPQNLGGALINLKEAMSKYTNIETVLDPQIRLSSPDLLKKPFIYIAFQGAFELTGAEKENLKNYLTNGGFIVLEQFALARDQNINESAYSRMIKDILGSQARVSPLSNSHKLYHCFFDFNDGPPIGGEMTAQTIGRKYQPSGKEVPISVSSKDVNYLEGISLDGRIVGICSSKKYLDKWKERGNNEPQLRMGVNMIVFALTQQGGLAAQ